MGSLTVAAAFGEWIDRMVVLATDHRLAPPPRRTPLVTELDQER